MIDFRSDTVTAPTEAMRKAMYQAEVGDDVYGDDSLTNQLEQHLAKLTNKEAAMFVPSGTFGNQVSILTHCQPSDEVILAEDCHIVMHEAGAAGLISGVQLRPLQAEHGKMPIADIKSTIRTRDIHFPKTALICLENAYSDGTVLSLDYLQRVYQLAQQEAIPLHLDGARLFNAATALGVTVDQISQYADSLNICLSKGLCAPIGSVVVGSADFIARARFNRKKLGGGMRQTGILAAAGLIAVEQMSVTLKRDHKLAQKLADGLAKLPGIAVIWGQRDINMVFFKISAALIDDRKFVEKLKEQDILINGVEEGLYRFVTHHWISERDIDYTVATIKTLLKERGANNE